MNSALSSVDFSARALGYSRTDARTDKTAGSDAQTDKRVPSDTSSDTYLPTLGQGVTSTTSSNPNDHAPDADRRQLLRRAGQQLTAGADGLNDEQQHQVAQLQSRDREVRAHEAAHQAAGGSLVGGASYSYQNGPDGKQYAIGGEVPVDVSAIVDDPQATIAKMQRVQSAALAPADPSGQDLAVAAQAVAVSARAQAELTAQHGEQKKTAKADGHNKNQDGATTTNSSDATRAGSPRNNIEAYHLLGSAGSPATAIPGSGFNAQA